MQYSQFGAKFAQDLGIAELMEDLNAGINDPESLMLGGGNPAQIPELHAELRQVLQRLSADDSLLATIANYDGPQGKDSFRSCVADYLRRRHGWDVSADNVALTNGSQNAFFYLFNMFSGAYADGSVGKILLPLAPEYIGYSDSPLAPGSFCAADGRIELQDDGFFKYRLDRDAIERILQQQPIKAICASRPTNPSGNALEDDEVEYLYAHARALEIPLILDYAYGQPFPGIVFDQRRPFYAPGCIACLSLSKLGLPGIRCGIVVADSAIIAQINRMNGVINLAPGGIGPCLANELFAHDRIDYLCSEYIQPFYRAKVEYGAQSLRAQLDAELLRLHRPEGGFFLWLWLPRLRINSSELYQRLKRDQLIVVSGHYFFPGVEQPGRHSQQCLRLNVAQAPEVMDRASALIAGHVRAASS